MKQYEQLLSGEDAGRERTREDDIYQLAQRAGISDPAVVDALYSDACERATTMREPVAVVYRRLLAGASAARTAPGKLTRTGALGGNPARWAPSSPG